MANLSQIRQYLQKNKIKHKVSDLGGEVYKVEDVIKVGVNPDEILKTLIVRSNVKEGLEFKDKYFAFVLRGKDRVDFKKVRRLLGGPSTSLRPSAPRLRLEEVDTEQLISCKYIVRILRHQSSDQEAVGVCCRSVNGSTKYL